MHYFEIPPETTPHTCPICDAGIEPNRIQLGARMEDGEERTLSVSKKLYDKIRRQLEGNQSCA